MSKSIEKGICFLNETDFVPDLVGQTLNVEHIKNNIFYLDENYKLKTTKVRDTQNTTVDELLKITTRSGRTIALTPKQPLLTIDGWKPAFKLEAKEHIATVRKYSLKIKKETDSDFIKILAYLLAEGGLTKHDITFSNINQKILGELKESVETRYFSLTLKKLKHGTCDYIISKKDLNGKKFYNDLSTDLTEQGLKYKNSSTKFIPDEIITSNDKCIALFLNRFFSCDGHVTKRGGYIELILKSERMIRQIQHLLLRFGILSTIYETIKCATNTKARKKRKYWRLTVSDSRSRKIFKEKIGLFLDEKQDRLVFDKKANTNLDIVPLSPRRLRPQRNYMNDDGTFKKGMKVKDMRKRYPSKLSNQKHVSRDMLLKFAEYHNNSDFYNLATSDVYWDEIKEIHPLSGSFLVWNLKSGCIENNFVVNDILVQGDTVYRGDSS